MVSDYCKIILIVCFMLRFQLFLIAIQLLNPVPDNDSIMADELGI